jgi:hypothetical protein
VLPNLGALFEQRSPQSQHHLKKEVSAVTERFFDSLSQSPFTVIFFNFVSPFFRPAFSLLFLFYYKSTLYNQNG